MIYRCGYCGCPVNKDGSLLSDDEYKKTIAAIDSGVAEWEHVHGECCHPDNQTRQMMQVSHEMALDAEMPEIEGQWIEWE